MTKAQVVYYTSRATSDLSTLLDSDPDTKNLIEAALLDRVNEESTPLIPDEAAPWIGELRGESWVRHVHFFPLYGPQEDIDEWARRHEGRLPLTSDCGLFIALVLDKGAVIILALIGEGMHEKLRDRAFMKAIETEARQVMQTL